MFSAMKSRNLNSMRRVGSRAAVLAAGTMAAVIGFASAAWAGPDTVSDVPNVSTTFNGEVFTAVVSGNTIYVGGTFTAARWNGTSSTRHGLAAVNATTGALLPWNPNATGEVRTLAVDGNNVYAGGNFTSIGGLSRTRLAEIDGTTGAVKTSFVHSANAEVRALVTGAGNLYAAGAFTAIDGHSAGFLAAFTLSTGARNTAWAPVADQRADALAFANNQVYVGGKFHTLSGVANPRLRALNPTNGAVISTFKPAAPYEVYGVAVGASGVYAAVAGPGGRAIGFSLTGAAQWTQTTDGDTQTVAVMGQTVYVGGHFDNACKTAATGTQGVCLGGSTHRGKLLAVNLSGVLQTWNPNGNGIQGTHQLVANTALHQIIAVGQWPQLNGVSHQGFAIFS